MVDVQKMADAVFASVKGYLASALTPLADRIKALEDRPIPEAVKGEDGRDGKDGIDGKSVTLDDLPLTEWFATVRRVAEDGLAEVRDSLRQPEDGKDGRDGADGKSFTVDEVRALVREAVEAEQAKWALDFERRAQDTMQRALDRMPAPKDGKDGADGKDGLGFDDLQMDYDGERRFTFSYVQGDKEKAFSFEMPMLLDRGVFKDGTEYEQGDVVTWGGSMWIAQTDTKSKPGEEGWRLAVKKGRDGKDGEKGDPGLKGRDGIARR